MSNQFQIVNYSSGDESSKNPKNRKPNIPNRVFELKSRHETQEEAISAIKDLSDFLVLEVDEFFESLWAGGNDDLLG